MSNNDILVTQLKEVLKPIIKEMIQEELRQHLQNKEPLTDTVSGLINFKKNKVSGTDYISSGL